jgi:diamine N-acetyltransferase
MNVSLRTITKDNFAAVIDLALLEHQEDHLASNAYSIAEASFYPDYSTRAVYQDEELVGFLMYASLAGQGDPGEYAIYRLMIDHRHQGKGYGRRAIELALAEIRAYGGVTRIWICYWPGNPTARQFYASVGFVETELDETGEMYAQISFSPT